MRRSAGDSLPTPGLPVLAGASGVAVDSSALSFLVQLAVKDKRRGGEAGGEGEGEGGEGAAAGEAAAEGDARGRFPPPPVASVRRWNPTGTTRRPTRLALTLRPRLLGQGGKGKRGEGRGRVVPLTSLVDFPVVLRAVPRARYVRDAHGLIVSGFFGDYVSGSHLFGVWCCLRNTLFSALLGSTVDTCTYVNLRWFFEPVYLAVTCSVLVLPEVYRIIEFYGR